MPSPEPRAEPPENPWETETVTVTVQDDSGSDRNFTEPVGEAVEYWNGRIETHTEYDVSLVYEPNRSGGYADLTVETVESVDRCGGTEEGGAIVGCYKDFDVVQVAGNRTDLQVRNTAIHEIGHALGLDHRDEPQWIMASGSDEGEGSRTDAFDRENPWNTTGDLEVAIGESIEHPDRVESNARSVADFYSETDRYTPEEVDVVVVDEWHEAHVVVEDGSRAPEEVDSSASVGYYSGLDYDSDDDYEQLTYATTYLEDVDPSDADYHVGYWVGNLLGNSESELPSRYRN